MDTKTTQCVAAARPSTFDYYTERYFHQYLVENSKGVEKNNCRVLVHSNGICVLCLDDSHAAISAARSTGTGANLSVVSVQFGTGRGNSKMIPEGIQVVGKRKRNALRCQVDTKICVITMTDGTCYNIPACIDGYIIELNSGLQERPNLLLTAPRDEGYIALLLPRYNSDSLSKYTKISIATGGEITDDDTHETNF